MQIMRPRTAALDDTKTIKRGISDTNKNREHNKDAFKLQSILTRLMDLSILSVISQLTLTRIIIKWYIF